MTQEEIEAFLKARFEAGELETGLYDAGLQYVVVDIVNQGNRDQLTFQWFRNMLTVDDLVHA